MIGRRPAVALALLLAATVLGLLIVETARGAEPAIVTAIRKEFGTGWLGGCFVAIAYRETGGTYNTRAANWRDVHSDGSRGSFGALQIGALWRSRGETVGAFAERMYDPAANARLAHRIYRRHGLAPWRGC